jgi:CelD/BcsL family acetyltransferase involved in cellulose biosynthesis
VDRQAVRYYLGGFEPAYARASVGALVVAHALAEAQRHGAREFDFLRGREPYKYAWGAQDRPLLRLRLYHSAARAQEEAPRPAQREGEEVASA